MGVDTLTLHAGSSPWYAGRT